LLKKRKISLPCQELNRDSFAVQPIAPVPIETETSQILRAVQCFRAPNKHMFNTAGYKRLISERRPTQL
jgi:uncharacterized protein (DUF1684 family)